ncbi:MAG: TolC family protein [Bdellovibrionales bacterium]|nr:TolC family protein [Bdellovibrionales bacterium]
MKTIVIILVGLITNITYAQEHCDFNNPNALLTRVKETHPSVLEAKLRDQAKQHLTAVAKQRPNPTLDAEALFGNPNSQFASDTFFSLQHTIELGGKRSTRIQTAQAQIDKSELQQRQIQETAMIDTAVQIYRLRQIDELSKLYQEATEAFRGIRKRLRRLPSRSPEQQVEMDTLELASNAYEFELIQKEAEKDFIEKHLAYFVGCRILPNSFPLPMQPRFPTEMSSYSDVTHSVQVKSARQDLQIARARLEQEKAKKTPNLRVGPAIGYGRSQGSDSVLFGAALSMPLPLLNTNQGQRAYQDANVRTATLRLKNVEQEAILDLEIWKERYQRFYQSLQKSNARSIVEKKHKRIESLFRRGVVSTALVIEAHRQLIDFSQAQLLFELGAVEALWNIYRITGNLDKGIL